MRFFIKAYPMHEHEVNALSAEARSGAIEADVHPGLVEGIADEGAIERLAAQGIIVQAIAMVTATNDGTPTPSENAPELDVIGTLPKRGELLVPELGVAELSTGVIDPRDPAPEYWLANVLGGLSDRVIDAIRDAGVEIVERDPSGALVLHVRSRLDRLRSLPYVSDLRPYGAVEAREGATSLLPDREAPSSGPPVGTRRVSVRAASARNALISSGVGGKPMRSKWTRRRRVRLSAGGAGVSCAELRPLVAVLSVAGATGGLSASAVADSRTSHPA